MRSVLDGILEGDFLNELIESEDLNRVYFLARSGITHQFSLLCFYVVLCHEDMRRGTPSLLDRSEDIFWPTSISIAESSCRSSC